MRRFDQLDKLNNRDAARLRWRKYMEPDFATAILSNADPMLMKTVHDQLCPDDNDYLIQSCRMWFVPAIPEDGWVMYLFDMLRKRIQVLDPAVGPFGFSTERVKVHEYVSNKLHLALFHCLDKFYTNWICTKQDWTRSFPILMAEKFASEDSGLCATFFVRHYDGDQLVIPLTQVICSSILAVKFPPYTP